MAAQGAARVIMAYRVMAYRVMAYTGMAYRVMAYRVMAYRVMDFGAMAKEGAWQLKVPVMYSLPIELWPT